MKIWITSDSHLNHFNIIRYCNRPYHTLDEMNSAIIRNWNSCISDEDIVLFLGDFCFARSAQAKADTIRWTSCLKGHKLIVKGNHDFKQVHYTDCGWHAEWYQEFVFHRFSFRHRPDDLWKDAINYDFIFYGHVHEKLLVNAPINTINVCLDANNMMPLDITNYFSSGEIEDLKYMCGIGE